MRRLTNAHDGVELERLLILFLEAMVAAMGGSVVGTAGITFSGQSSSLQVINK